MISVMLSTQFVILTSISVAITLWLDRLHVWDIKVTGFNVACVINLIVMYRAVKVCVVQRHVFASCCTLIYC
jgi:hypothetical protein